MVMVVVIMDASVVQLSLCRNDLKMYLLSVPNVPILDHLANHSITARPKWKEIKNPRVDTKNSRM
jgi:hypothetical protein